MFKRKKIISLIVSGSFLFTANVVNADYKYIIKNVFFDTSSSLNDSSGNAVDPGYVENNHQCFGGENDSICDYNGTDLLVVDRETLMDILDGNVSGNLYSYGGRTWDVDQVYTGNVIDFSQRSSGLCNPETDPETGLTPPRLSPFVPRGFNSDISMWDIGSARNMARMFACNDTFNQPLNNWVVSNVTNFDAMFGGSAFNQPLNNWDMRNAEQVQSMFHSSAFNQDISNWVFRDLITANSLFAENTSFNKPVNWDLSGLQNQISLEGMFRDATLFDSSINMDFSKVNSTRGMFKGAISFNQPIDHFNMSNITNINEMFMNAGSFNQNLNSWVFSPDLDSMNDIFNGASNFNGAISNWNVENIKTFRRAWANTNLFNRDISQWCTVSVDQIDDIKDFDLNASSWSEVNKPNWTQCPP